MLAETVAQGDISGIITSGGGFSEYYPMPAWQAAAVSAYFTSAAAALHTPMAGYATAGRGYPDVSLAGLNYVLYVGGTSGLASGTSASSPAVAGFFSNVNAARMAIGKGSLGWVNPALYRYGAAFMNDITSGHTKCVAGGTCCPQGFYATPGWDPACGLGSPNYGKMHPILVALGSGNSVQPTSSPTSTSTPTLSPTSSQPSAPTPSPTPFSPPFLFPPFKPFHANFPTQHPSPFKNTLTNDDLFTGSPSELSTVFPTSALGLSANTNKGEFPSFIVSIQIINVPNKFTT
jgi:hypothetical protein